MAEAPLNRLNPVDALCLLADVVGSLKAHGIIALGADGHYNFVDAGTGALIAEGVDIEGILKAHGLKVPEKVDKLIALLPVVLPLLEG